MRRGSCEIPNTHGLAGPPRAPVTETRKSWLYLGMHKSTYRVVGGMLIPVVLGTQTPSMLGAHLEGPSHEHVHDVAARDSALELGVRVASVVTSTHQDMVDLRSWKLSG